MSNTNERPSRNTLLDRRTYLRAAAGATVISALGKSASASGGDFDVIQVPSGETRTFQISDGETFENKIIDITADRAAVRFNVNTTSASTTIIRNVGIRGQFNHNDYNANAIVVRARHPDGKIIFDNFYWGDGCESNPNSNADPSGVSVRPEHAGTVEFNRFTMREFPDNALYASPAGHQSDHPAGPGAGGRVDVRNSYFGDNMVSDIRPGTDGEIVNCGLYGNPHRGIWANQHDSDGGQYVRDCHIQSGGSRAIAVGNNNWDGGQQNWVELQEGVHVDDGGLYTYNGGNEIRGEPAGSPQRHDPGHFGAPESAEEAASGSGEPPSDPVPSDPVLPEGDFTLEMTTEDDLAVYLLELDAAHVEPGDNADTWEHDYQDRAFEHDGRWYVHGYVAGGSDDFHVEDGEILRVGELGGSTQITADGSRLTLTKFDEITTVPDPDEDEDEDDEVESPGTDFVVEITSSDLAEYLLELDAAQVEPGDDADTWDHEYQDRAFEYDGHWYVHGFTAGGVDDFSVEKGEILRVGALKGSPRISVDGDEIDLKDYETIDSVPDEDDGSSLPQGDFTLEMTTDDDLAEYLLELDAAHVEPGDNADTWDHDYQDRAFEHDGSWYVHGYVANASDDYEVEDGEILRFGNLDGSAQVQADGETLDFDGVDSIDAVPSMGPRTLEVAGQFEYRIEVSGEIEPGEEHARWLTEGDSYGDDWAEWWLSGGENARTVWHFTGEITHLEIDDFDGTTDVLTLEVDGEPIDVDDYR